MNFEEGLDFEAPPRASKSESLLVILRLRELFAIPYSLFFFSSFVSFRGFSFSGSCPGLNPMPILAMPMSSYRCLKSSAASVGSLSSAVD